MNVLSSDLMRSQLLQFVLNIGSIPSSMLWSLGAKPGPSYSVGWPAAFVMMNCSRWHWWHVTQTKLFGGRMVLTVGFPRCDFRFVQRVAVACHVLSESMVLARAPFVARQAQPALGC